MSNMQQRANEMLTVWQLQRIAGIAPEDRRLPSFTNDNYSYERDMEIIRHLLERE